MGRRCRRDEAMQEGAYNVLPATLESVLKDNDHSPNTSSANLPRRASFRNMKRGSTKSSIYAF
jgi:hypothetical protein